uniref:Uncharacterized protein n=1 Tax=Oryza sativa subsp. japonica TaxID=39947 RepID=Q6H604_ORYSJ|nr:hypothetical protein [Oryza sativa Japonica Group]
MGTAGTPGRAGGDGDRVRAGGRKARWRGRVAGTAGRAATFTGARAPPRRRAQVERRREVSAQGQVVGGGGGSTWSCLSSSSASPFTCRRLAPSGGQRRRRSWRRSRWGSGHPTQVERRRTVGADGIARGRVVGGGAGCGPRATSAGEDHPAFSASAFASLLRKMSAPPPTARPRAPPHVPTAHRPPSRARRPSPALARRRVRRPAAQPPTSRSRAPAAGRPATSTPPTPSRLLHLRLRLTSLQDFCAAAHFPASRATRLTCRPPPAHRRLRRPAVRPLLSTRHRPPLA